MTCQAVCTDCGWRYRDDSEETVTAQLERHAMKELHFVTFERVEPASA